MKFQGGVNEYFEVVNVTYENQEVLEDPLDGQLSVLWFEDDSTNLNIDAKDLNFQKDELLCLTSFHKIKVNKLGAVKFLRFNSSFYCIVNHDSEVGCKGVLFFGAKALPILRPKDEALQKLDAIVKMLFLEMASRDSLQLEMLQMMLKRFLILCTRVYKSQEAIDDLKPDQVDIVREYNFLVEKHFKEKHTVSEYAQLLNKSPKTLANLFGKFHDKTPLQLIQERKMLEVRRKLKYTDLPVSEIGYDVGFNDVQSFSRFFKKNEGVSPTEFRLR